jgi:hypothetical protein
MVDLKIGDRYPWVPRKQVQNGGRPDNGNVDGEGYMECPECGKDSFLLVVVRNDVIEGVEPNATRQGYIPDRPWIFKIEEVSANCYRCEATPHYDSRSISRVGFDDVVAEIVRDAYKAELILGTHEIQASYDVTRSYLWRWRSRRETKHPGSWTVTGPNEERFLYNAETKRLIVERPVAKRSWEGQISELAKPNCDYFRELVRF